MKRCFRIGQSPDIRKEDDEGYEVDDRLKERRLLDVKLEIDEHGNVYLYV